VRVTTFLSVTTSICDEFTVVSVAMRALIFAVMTLSGCEQAIVRNVARTINNTDLNRFAVLIHPPPVDMSLQSDRPSD